MSKVMSGNFNYNDAIAAGFDNYESAKKYSDDYIAQTQAAAQAQSEQQAFENYIKQQQLANDTAYKNAQIAKLNRSGTNTSSNGGYNLNSALNLIKDMDIPRAEATIDALADSGQLSKETYQGLYKIIHSE
jgi:hypothetical protein